MNKYDFYNNLQATKNELEHADKPLRKVMNPYAYKGKIESKGSTAGKPTVLAKPEQKFDNGGMVSKFSGYTSDMATLAKNAAEMSKKSNDDYNSFYSNRTESINAIRRLVSDVNMYNLECKRSVESGENKYPKFVALKISTTTNPRYNSLYMPNVEISNVSGYPGRYSSPL